MISIVLKAFISFVSTNIDDIFVLMLFFSQINDVMKKRHIVIGQYLGIGVLTAISIIGAMGVSVIPSEYVGLLGLVPIYLGIKAHIDYKKESKDSENSKVIKSFINPSVIKVFSVTLANGGDNIGIYIPLFANMSLMNVLVTVAIFILLVAIWCFIAIKLVEYPFVHNNIERYKHIFVPIVFICLGILILMENKTINFTW